MKWMNKTKKFVKIAVVAGTLIFGGLVISGNSVQAIERPLRDDVITLTLSVEDWVETSTARVVVMADLAVPAGSLQMARAEAERALSGSARADWRMTRFNQRGVEAGLERWRIFFEARLAADKLADLGAKVKAGEKAGRGFKIAEVDYSPTLAERQAAMASLRTQIYAQVDAELKQVNKAFPGRDFRVRSVGFGPIGRPQPHLMRAEAAGQMKAMAAPAQAMDQVSVKLTLTANVQLAAFAKEK